MFKFQNVRNMLDRKKYVHMLEITLQHKLESYYNIMTVLIQKTYRGYISRKKLFDFYKMKEWIQLISKFNFPKNFIFHIYFHL